jgi:nucleotide-binding universal stress UspA family protein
MIPFRKLILPVDYSRSCQAMVPYVRAMADHFSAELTLVHGYASDFLPYEGAIPKTDPSETGQRLQTTRLQDFARDGFPNRHVEIVASLGDASTVIGNVVEREGADLVMMPTHGRGVVRRFLLGSVTTKVLHDLSAAVWTATTAALDRDPPSVHYKSILCAVDESDEAEGVLRAAASLALSYGAQLQIIHVLEVLPVAYEVDFAPYAKVLRDAANVRLRELKSALGIDTGHTVKDGPVVHEIREEAVRTKADLIVTGRGRSQGMFAGLRSQMYQIVRESPCPVLSI